VTVGLSTYSAVEICLALTLGCVTDRPAPQPASSTSATIAATSTRATSAIVDSSRAASEIDSVALNAPIPVGFPAAKEPQCPDSVDVFECYALQVEKPILATTGFRVRRIGDTLRVNTNVKTLSWIDSEMSGEGFARHFYEGTISVPGGKKYAVVRHDLYEDNPYVLIDWLSGDTVSVPDRPVVSPDSSKIVAGEFSEDGRLELEVWNLALEPPKQEFAREWDGAGPVNIAWRDNRTIDFRLRQTSGGRKSVPTPTPMVLIHQDSTWRLAASR
jgi:hypothetical protein